MAYLAQQKTMIRRRRHKMAELKYKKYIVTDLKTPEEVQKTATEYAKRATRILWLDDEVIEGAFHVNCSWYWKATEEEGTPSHTHDFDEVIAFFGSDPQNPHDLGGEVEFWLEDEKYILTKSCLIFAPRGLRHCPLRVMRVDRPIFFLAISTTSKYVKENIIRASS
jgi:quercetin dioxygenase-like cupin family protein